MGSAAESPRKQEGILVAGHFDREFGYGVDRPAGDTAWFMTLTLEGRGLFRLGDTSLICEKGDVTAVRPGTPQHYATAEGHSWNFIWCHFLPSSGWNSMLRALESEPGGDRIFRVHFDTADFEEVYRAFERVHKYRLSNIPLYLNGLEEILIRLSHTGEGKGRASIPAFTR